MPITSALGRLNNREVSKSEGLLKAASHPIFKNHLPQKQKPPFSVKVWYLLILRDLELTSSELWGTASASCYPACLFSALPASGNSHPALCTLKLLSTLCSPTYTKTCIYQVWPSHTPVNPSDQAVPCPMPRTLISLVPSCILGLWEGLTHAVTALHNLFSPAPVLVPAPCVESSRWMNLKGPLVTWNKLQFPFTIK